MRRTGNTDDLFVDNLPKMRYLMHKYMRSLFPWNTLPGRKARSFGQRGSL